MKKLVKTLILAGLLCQTESVEAAGFLLSEQSVSSMGTAFAANTSGVEDASTVYLNPAGMTSLQTCNDFVAGVTYIYPNGKYHDRGTINALGRPFPTSTNGGQLGNDAWLPYLSYVKKLGCRWAAGITINSPYGLSTEYNDEWYGRYYATHSKLMNTNINPAIAFDVTDNLTIGAGISASYLHVELKNMVDFGLIAFEASGFNPALAGLPENQDGKVKVKGCAWGIGGNVGLLYKFNCNRTRIGIQYRSQIHYNINNGHVTYHNVPSAPVNIAASGRFVNGGAKAKVTLPDIVSAGITHRWNDTLTLYGDVQWANWNCLQKLTINFKKPLPSLQSSTSTLKWRSTWRLSLGAKYDVNCNLALRAGYMYDQSPSDSNYYRSPRVPDSTRQVVACGLQYWVNECFGIDLAYMHFFFRNAYVNKTSGIAKGDTEVQAAGGLKGRWRSFADLVGAQIHVRF